MPFIAKGNNIERKLPEPGLHLAVCVDVVDLGEETTPWKDNKTGEQKIQHKCRIVWELDEQHPDFEGPHRVSQKYTVSLDQRANLRKDLERWRGKAFTDSELQGFDLEKLIGISAQLNIVHTDDGEWANVDTVLPAPRGTKLDPSGYYVRVKERDDTAAGNGSNGQGAVAPSDYGDNRSEYAKQYDDELPF